MASKMSFKEFVNDWYSMDTYTLTDEDKKNWNPGLEKMTDILKEQISKLSDENIMNYSLMIEIIIAIKMKYMLLTDEEKQSMTENEYRRLSKYVVELHKMRETVVCKCFKILLDNAIEDKESTITLKVRNDRLDTLTRCFPSPMDLFTYLVKKMNLDKDISLNFGSVDENGNIKCALLPDEELINTMIQENEEDNERRDIIIETLANLYMGDLFSGDEDRSGE